MQPIKGIHHVTALASDPQANVDFYRNVLGQRLIKTTVNFDDPGTYHFYYGDETGAPGTILTFFPWPSARRGTPGNGEVGALAYAIRSASVDYWRQRLVDHGVTVGQTQTRFGTDVIPFQDPDGMALELIVNDRHGSIRFWEGGPIPSQHALRGFHGVTLWVAEAERTTAVLTEQMGYALVAEEGNRWRFKGASNDVGLYVDLLVRPNMPRGRMGAGSFHHVAFRTRDDDEQAEYRRTLSEVGLGVTTVRDRQYFRSIYFREPAGVLFEIATDQPGFAVDEAVEDLGTSLKLPPWLESRRESIENALPSVTVKPTAREEQKERGYA